MPFLMLFLLIMLFSVVSNAMHMEIENDTKKDITLLFSLIGSQPPEIQNIIMEHCMAKGIPFTQALQAHMFPFSYEENSLMYRDEKLEYKLLKSIRKGESNQRLDLDYPYYTDVRSILPHNCMILGLNKNNNILMLLKRSEEPVLYVGKIEENRMQLGKVAAFVGYEPQGLIALHFRENIFLYQGEGSLLLSSFIINKEKGNSLRAVSMLFNAKDEKRSLIGEKIYHPLRTKAQFIPDGLFIAAINEKIFLYDYARKCYEWGKCTIDEIAAMVGIHCDAPRKCVVNNLHYSESFPQHAFLDFDLLKPESEEKVDESQKVTRYLLSLATTDHPAPKIVDQISFTRTKQRDGSYKYSKSYAFYTFIDNQQPQLHMDLRGCNYVNSEGTRHIDIHTMPTGLADTAIDIEQLMLMKLFFRIKAYRSNSRNKEEIMWFFYGLSQENKKRMVALTSLWSLPQVDQETGKTYRKLLSNSPLGEILEKK